MYNCDCKRWRSVRTWGWTENHRPLSGNCWAVALWAAFRIKVSLPYHSNYHSVSSVCIPSEAPRRQGLQSPLVTVRVKLPYLHYILCEMALCRVSCVYKFFSKPCKIAVICKTCFTHTHTHNLDLGEVMAQSVFSFRLTTEHSPQYLAHCRCSGITWWMK